MKGRNEIIGCKNKRDSEHKQKMENINRTEKKGTCATSINV